MRVLLTLLAVGVVLILAGLLSQFLARAWLRGFLFALAVVYALIALTSASAAFVYLAFGPRIADLPERWMTAYHLLFFVVFPLAAIASLAIAYAFCTVREWGRLLAVALNALYVMITLIGAILSAWVDSAPISRVLSSGGLAIVGFCIGNIVFLLQPNVRALFLPDSSPNATSAAG